MKIEFSFYLGSRGSGYLGAVLHMYKIEEVTIDGFWNEFEVHALFKDDVNIVIGKNGSGKTTFMNILHAVLSVDMDALYENDFQLTTIKLHDGKAVRTISAEKHDQETSPFPSVVYRISTKKFMLPIVGAEDRSLPLSIRRRAHEEARNIRDELGRLVRLASLSVYRMENDIDPEVGGRSSRRASSPVDMRLTMLMQHLTHYQLELSNQAREVSSKLQRDVLISLLYRREQSKSAPYSLNFDENKERQRLIAAYAQLGVSGSDITKRIHDHTVAISEAVAKIKSFTENDDLTKLDFGPLDARSRTGGIIDMSLSAEEKTKAIFAPMADFVGALKEFIPEKEFSFDGGDLQINRNEIPIARLSSGEKQLLILFIEALLQRHNPYVFLADEPELSLHISWQRKIIAAIRKLNPLAQVIVATHSPEIAGGFPDKIMDMEDMRRA